MLSPFDYSKTAIFDEDTRALMNRIEFEHGGKEFDDLYPEGIPTSVSIKSESGQEYDSGLVMFPGGHSRNETVDLRSMLQHKFKLLGKIALDKDELVRFTTGLENIHEMSNSDLETIYECNIKFHDESID